MTGTPARRFLRPALLVAALFGAASAPAQNAVPVSVAASDKPKDAAWSAMPIDDVRQRAHASEVAAMEELGRRLLSGSGVPRDASSGAGWYRRAADAGSPTAAFTTGVLYERGLGVERDSTKAVEWYRQAAARDVPAAKPFAGRIVDAAQHSFVTGMHAAVLVAAAIAIIGGIGVLVWLPARARTHPDDIDLVAHDPAAVADEVAARAEEPAGIGVVPPTT